MTTASIKPITMPEAPPSQLPIKISKPIKAANNSVVLSVLKFIVLPSDFIYLTSPQSGFSCSNQLYSHSCRGSCEEHQ